MKISVALCTYNGEKYLQEQIESIMQQTRPPDEVVICDDMSSDNSVSIIRDLQKKFNTINLFINDRNLGAKLNFEKAIELTTGDVIFLSDQDDVWMPDKIAQFLKEFKENPQAKAMFSDGYLLYEEGISQSKSLWETVGFNEAELMRKNPYRLFAYINYFDNVVTGAALAFKKEAKDIILPFKGKSSELHDYWICTALAQKGIIVPFPRRTFAYRIHPAQQIGIVNVQYIDSLNKAKRKLLYDEKSLSDREEFHILWSANRRYKHLKSMFDTGAEGILSFKTDLQQKKQHFFRGLSMYKRMFYKFAWMAKDVLAFR